MNPVDITNKTIVLAPLDWGLGHATRCIPLIRTFLKANNKVVFAGVKAQIDLIQKDFEDVYCEEIEGYSVRLDSKRSTYLQMIQQSQLMLKMIKKERKIADKLAQKHNVDIVISDNRYGFQSSHSTNIFITHQLSPPVPRFRKLLTKKIQSWVNTFDICWIPDNPKNPMCEELHSVQLDIPKLTIGFLSRFERIETPKRFDILVVASGPEPERSNFIDFAEDILKDLDKTYLIIGPDQLEIKNYKSNPSSSELEVLINSADLIVSRAGYTTLMELIHLNKKAVLVPTAGQYEQEYLANTVKDKKVIFCKLKELKQIVHE